MKGVALVAATITFLFCMVKSQEISGLSRNIKSYTRVKRMASRCVDSNSIDCPEWAELGYCTHLIQRYSSWMKRYCFRSCGYCRLETTRTIASTAVRTTARTTTTATTTRTVRTATTTTAETTPTTTARTHTTTTVGTTPTTTAITATTSTATTTAITARTTTAKNNATTTVRTTETTPSQTNAPAIVRTTASRRTTTAHTTAVPEKATLHLKLNATEAPRVEIQTETTVTETATTESTSQLPRRTTTDVTTTNSSETGSVTLTMATSSLMDPTAAISSTNSLATEINTFSASNNSTKAQIVRTAQVATTFAISSPTENKTTVSTTTDISTNAQSTTVITTRETLTTTTLRARNFGRSKSAQILSDVGRSQKAMAINDEATRSTCFPTNCGLLNRSSMASENRGAKKIVGGRRSLKGDSPWHGLLLIRSKERFRYCGLSVICSKWLVTAGHCVHEVADGLRNRAVSISIYLGRYRGMYGLLSNTVQFFDKFDIKAILVHPRFGSNPRYENDIALIQLKTAVRFNEFVSPVCLPEANDLIENESLTAFGWGATLGHGPNPNFLKEVDLKYVPNNVCRTKVWGLGSGTFCGKAELGNDTCYGDSGGSLVKKPEAAPASEILSGAARRHVIYGVTSYGAHHCNTRRPLVPSVYTDVAFYHSWIVQTTKACCDS